MRWIGAEGYWLRDVSGLRKSGRDRIRAPLNNHPGWRKGRAALRLPMARNQKSSSGVQIVVLP